MADMELVGSVLGAVGVVGPSRGGPVLRRRMVHAGCGRMVQEMAGLAKYADPDGKC